MTLPKTPSDPPLMTLHTDVWLGEKGLAHEDQLASPQDTLENLQKECYAQFGILLKEC